MSDAKYVTWKGEDDRYFINQIAEDGTTIEKVQTAGPSFLMWNKIRFDKDKPKLIDPAAAKTADEKTMFAHILKKTANMAQFTVEDVAAPKKAEPEPMPATQAEPDDEDDEPPAHAPAHHRRSKARR